MEALRTTLWFVPSILIVVGIVIFLITFNMTSPRTSITFNFRRGFAAEIQNRAGKCSLPSLRRSSRWSVSSSP